MQNIQNIVFYQNLWEKEFIKKYFKNFNVRDSRLIGFLKGLDEDSCNQAIKIINNLHKLIHNNYQDFQLYNIQESITFTEDLKINDEILMLGETLFCHRGYFLTVQHFTNDIFKYKYSIHKISNKDFISKGTIIDIGGCSGDSALVFNRELKPDSLYVIEPNHYWAEQIEKVFEINDVKNGRVLRHAVSDKNQKISFFSDNIGGVSGASEIHKMSRGDVSEEIIDALTFDTIVDKYEIKNIKFIKIDIEGFEKMFLHGAKESITEFRPVIMICIYHSWDDFCDVKTIIEGWDLGYKFKIDKALNGCIVLETVLICEPQ